MRRVDELKARIERLTNEERAELLQWMTDMEWERWDKQIAEDFNAGRLDFLIDQARRAKVRCELRDL